jgi:MinD superfamily P-loop ATPase
MINKKPIKIAIASGKGGTGKTTLSTNLAAYLAEQSNVVLVDLDVEEPNSGLFLKGTLIHQEEKNKMIPGWEQDKCTLCGICQNSCAFHAILQLGSSVVVLPELCHGCYACSELCPTQALPMQPKQMGKLTEYKINDTLHFVESRLNIGEEQAVPLIKHTKKYVTTKYSKLDFQIYDCPPGTSCSMIEATRDADFVILITEPTPFGLHDVRLAVETMRKLNKFFGIVINRFGIGNDDIITYCDTENIPIIAKIYNSRKIAELYSSGKLIYNEIPEVKEAFNQIVNYCKAFKKEMG